MYLLNELKFNIAASHTIGDTQYPRGWFLDPENRAAAGVVEVPDPAWPNPEIYSASENPDGSLTIVPLDPEVIEQNAIAKEKSRIYALWQAAHDYEFAQISGSAIGLLAMGVMQGKPKCIAVQNWIKSIWVEYYTRKASGSFNNDFSGSGSCPYTVPELMEELGV